MAIPGAQGLVDRGPAGQQAELVDRGPLDAAERNLQRDDPVESAPDRCPVALEVLAVVSDQPVVPEADREVGAAVGFAAGILDLDR